VATENTTDTQNSTTETPAATDDSQKLPASSTTEPEKKDDGADKGDTILTGADDDAGGKGAGDKDAPVAKKGEDDGDGPKPNPLLGAPEGDYTIDVAKLPEGTTLDDGALAALTPVAKEIGLSDEGMTRLAGVYAETILPGVTAQVVKGIEDQVAVQRKEWDAETRTAIEEDAKVEEDKRVFDGKSFAEVRQVAAKALDRFGGAELREFLDTSGLGNNRAMVQAFYTIGKSIKEDSFERGGTAPSKKSDEELFYGKQGS
jgi:hypothetical protein